MAVRVRPLNRTEKELKNKEVWRCNPTTIQEKDDEGKPTGKVIPFDHVFNPHVSTDEVYQNMAEHIIEGAMDGYNGCVVFPFVPVLFISVFRVRAESFSLCRPLSRGP